MYVFAVSCFPSCTWRNCLCRCSRCSICAAPVFLPLLLSAHVACADEGQTIPATCSVCVCRGAVPQLPASLAARPTSSAAPCVVTRHVIGRARMYVCMYVCLVGLGSVCMLPASGNPWDTADWRWHGACDEIHGTGVSMLIGAVPW